MNQYQVVPNVIGSLIYFCRDNFLLDDLIKEDDYQNNELFIGLIESHLKDFSRETERKLGKSIYYKFDDEKYNTKIFYYEKSKEKTHQFLTFQLWKGGFFTKRVIEHKPMSDKSLFIFDSVFDVSMKPDFEWRLDVSEHEKKKYKEIKLEN